MLRDEAVAQIKQILGHRTDQDANIVATMQTCQTTLELAPVKPWFLLSENATIRTTIGESRIRVPDDFLEEADDDALVYVPDDTTIPEVQLIKDDLDALKAQYATRTTADGAAEPEAYSLDGYYFRLFPTPDALYLIRMLYYKKAALLTTNIENVWLKHVPFLLIGMAGKIAAAGLRDANAMKEFDMLEKQSLLLINSQEEAREHSNRRYQMGGRH